jgi:hypothetical protein
MIIKILIVVLLLWLIGVATAYTLGGLIHLLLLLALIILFIEILERRSFLAENQRRSNLKPLVLLGIALILLGIVALSYQRITYTTKEKIIDIGQLQATAEREKSIPLPPLLGGLALVAGIGLVAVGYRNPRR